jgi:hypothetical protein
MPTWLSGTMRTARNLGLAALVAALLSSWLFAPSRAAGRDAYYGAVVDPTVDIGRAMPRLAELGVHTVRLRMDVKDWARPSANTGTPEHDGALGQAAALDKQGFRVVLQVNSVGGAVPSYARASGLFEWLLRRPGAGAVDVVEVFGPVTDHDSDSDAFSATLPMDAQAHHYVDGPLRAAWDVFHAAGKDVLGGAFTLWQQARNFNTVGTYTLAVTRAYVRAGYLKYVDFAGLQPYVASPASQLEWVRQAKKLFGRKPVWISEWGLNRVDYPSLTAYTEAMSRAVTALRPQVDVVCYATFTPSATSDGLVQPGLSGYRRVQPAFDRYRSWPKR